MGSDLSIVNAARVSFNKVCVNFSDGDRNLIQYLAKHNHWTPFAHTSISIRVKCPIFVARQLGKHQVGLVWNEVSRRYVDEEPEFFWPKEWRGKPVNAKQGSDGVVDWQIDPRCVIIALDTYESALIHGVAPEQARMILPQNMMTEFIWTGSLAAFSRVYKLRIDTHAQKEVQDIAVMLDKVINPLFPVGWKVLND